MQPPRPLSRGLQGRGRGNSWALMPGPLGGCWGRGRQAGVGLGNTTAGPGWGREWLRLGKLGKDPLGGGCEPPPAPTSFVLTPPPTEPGWGLGHRPGAGEGLNLATPQAWGWDRRAGSHTRAWRLPADFSWGLLGLGAPAPEPTPAEEPAADTACLARSW